MCFRNHNLDFETEKYLVLVLNSLDSFEIGFTGMFYSAKQLFIIVSGIIYTTTDVNVGFGS